MGDTAVRRLLTASDLRRMGLSDDAIHWGSRVGRWRSVERGIYAEGPAEPTRFDRARAMLLATRGIASGTMAAALLGLDGVESVRMDFTIERSRRSKRPGVRRRDLAETRVVEVFGVRCTDALQTLVDLAAELDDISWEAALESALRRRLVTLGQLDQAALGSQRGVARMRRVLALRPLAARPTESLLETRMVQLARTVAGLPAPERQVDVYGPHDEVVARLDLAWPALGLFIELDGQHHRDQPLYDARRETAVVAATGWLCGRFTWKEVVHLPVATARRLEHLFLQAQRRPIASPPL